MTETVVLSPTRRLLQMSSLKQRACASYRAGLSLYTRGGRDEQALALLDTSDWCWARIKALQNSLKGEPL